jgi:hypothetical protein
MREEWSSQAKKPSTAAQIHAVFARRREDEIPEPEVDNQRHVRRNFLLCPGKRPHNDAAIVQ